VKIQPRPRPSFRPTSRPLREVRVPSTFRFAGLSRPLLGSLGAHALLGLGAALFLGGFLSLRPGDASPPEIRLEAHLEAVPDAAPQLRTEVLPPLPPEPELEPLPLPVEETDPDFQTQPPPRIDRCYARLEDFDPPPPEPVPARAPQPEPQPARPQRPQRASAAPSASPPVEASYVEPSLVPGRCPPPVYPSSARRRGLEGVVVLWVRVSAAGELLDLGIEQSSGHPILDEAALRAVRKWQFQPATRGEEAVEGRLRFRVRFELHS